ncbi:MurR/RpiR family transcriptional regulator [Halomonas elongata]|uniref:MurR/RpiR family transcriptional regulator n=2 Tax=Halomonas elongata TaxID=2746 RepID=E1V752_HALED|nr:MurR/RpiR family transcriptional regulator [Halomonas elongata]OBX37820.1 HTH-type transcriptional regulator RpiR [Halomonas elongata]RAW06905.1 MurR/RpiR family transcriptional regulator [Halomonas elongata]WBF18637.1 MurR/RpiR family transcriptional regulator [Halomonas elongata]WPU47492.1 MurR/RpiR family transcriptional regulator [Halomonas elongata DSM 2581]WVI72161.1 MurR/RpiR family transcriptional regulator [Halomonas elongata]
MTQDIDILSRITSDFAGLRDAEKKVAELIFADIDFVSEASIGDIAARADVSDASVTRFARAVGCQNVRDLKLRLARALAAGRRFIQDAGDTDGLGAVYDIATQTLEVNRELMEQADVAGAIELLDGARQILVFGAGGGSTMLAQELQFRLVRLGYAISAYPQSLLPRMVASTLEPDDVVVTLSVSGYTPEIVESAQIARQYGARVVAITANGSPLAETADVVLPVAARETDFIYHPSASRYAVLAAIDVLALELALRHQDRSRDKLRRLKITLDAHRGGDNRQPLGD